MNKLNKGFTLIELMIVVAIIGILAAVAIPMYRDYTIRSQIGEGINLASGTKVAITEYFQDKGTPPTSNAQAGVDDAIEGKYVASVSVGAGGIVTITFGGDANANLVATGTLLMTPDFVTSPGSVQWICGGAGLPDKWLPAACRP